LTLVSQYRPLVLEADDLSDSKILREYAEFWKIPWQTQVNLDQQHTTIITGPPTGPPARKATVLVSPSGRGMAAKIAETYGLTLSLQTRLILSLIHI